MKLNFITLIVIALCLVTPIVCHAQDNTKITKNDIKITLLSIGSGSSRFTYERAFNELQSAELTLGVIGMGVDWMNESAPTGLLLKFAYKFNLIPQKNASSWLAGFYVKPELVYASYDYDYQKDDNTFRDHTRRLALLAECGYQLVLKWFVFDIYAGLGSAFGDINENNYYHSFMQLNKNSDLSVTSGFRVGVGF